MQTMSCVSVPFTFQILLFAGSPWVWRQLWGVVGSTFVLRCQDRPVRRPGVSTVGGSLRCKSALPGVSNECFAVVTCPWVRVEPALWLEGETISPELDKPAAQQGLSCGVSVCLLPGVLWDAGLHIFPSPHSLPAPVTGEVTGNPKAAVPQLRMDLSGIDSPSHCPNYCRNDPHSCWI